MTSTERAQTAFNDWIALSRDERLARLALLHRLIQVGRENEYEAAICQKNGETP